MSEERGVSRRRILAAGCVAAAGKLMAKDNEFWNHKEPADWATDEIDRLITRSPWAKEVSATESQGAHTGGGYPGGQGGGHGRSTGIGVPGIGGLGIPGMGGGRGGHGTSQHPSTQVKLIGRWESAKPILEALRQPLPEALAGHYVIGISGVPAAEMRGQDDDSEERVKGLTYIEVAHKSLQPGVVQQSPSTSTSTLLFGFSKELLTLSEGDGDVHFTTQTGHMQVKVKFSLSEMMYRGQLAV